MLITSKFGAKLKKKMSKKEKAKAKKEKEEQEQTTMYQGELISVFDLKKIKKNILENQKT